jgi:hypothetical protein
MAGMEGMARFRLQLLRALAPSWRFFDRPGVPYVLEVRWLAAPGATGSGTWERPYPGVRGGMGSLFFSARSNLALAWQSLNEQLVHEIHEFEGEPSAFAAESVGYALVCAGLAELSHGRGFQFRITCGGDLVLLSPEFAGQGVLA